MNFEGFDELSRLAGETPTAEQVSSGNTDKNPVPAGIGDYTRSRAIEAATGYRVPVNYEGLGAAALEFPDAVSGLAYLLRNRDTVGNLKTAIGNAENAGRADAVNRVAESLAREAYINNRAAGVGNEIGEHLGRLDHVVDQLGVADPGLAARFLYGDPARSAGDPLAYWRWADTLRRSAGTPGEPVNFGPFLQQTALDALRDDLVQGGHASTGVPDATLTSFDDAWNEARQLSEFTRRYADNRSTEPGRSRFELKPEIARRIVTEGPTAVAPDLPLAWRRLGYDPTASGALISDFKPRVAGPTEIGGVTGAELKQLRDKASKERVDRVVGDKQPFDLDSSTRKRWTRRGIAIPLAADWAISHLLDAATPDAVHYGK